MSYAKGKNVNVVFLPLRYSAGDTYRGSGLVQLELPPYREKECKEDVGVKFSVENCFIGPSFMAQHKC